MQGRTAVFFMVVIQRARNPFLVVGFDSCLNRVWTATAAAN